MGGGAAAGPAETLRRRQGGLGERGWPLPPFAACTESVRVVRSRDHDPSHHSPSDKAASSCPAHLLLPQLEVAVLGPDVPLTLDALSGLCFGSPHSHHGHRGAHTATQA